jgi:hypothetical protein
MSDKKEKKKGQDSVRVLLRVRPVMGREIELKHTTKNITYDDDDTKVINVSSAKHKCVKNFNFHRVLRPDSSQELAYNEFAKDAVNHALDGFHGVLFVYGQTGSGKTFTMSNEEPGQLGMLQRSLQDVWSRIEQDQTYDYDIAVSYVQLYNEQLTDLLGDNGLEKVRLAGIADRRNDVKIINEGSGQGVEREVTSYEDTMGLFRRGADRKQMSSTAMNDTSSRSHTVFSMYIRKQSKTEKSVSGDMKALEGRLVICDLAGSERIKKTNAAGTQVTEANSINLSLLVLGRVVAALTDKSHSQHAPFRESQLTRLLQFSLSGWGKTSIMVNVSPSDDNTEETISAIDFGQRAIRIKQQAERRAVIDYKALYLDLQKQLDERRDQAVEAAMAEIGEGHTEHVRQLEERVGLLEKENAILRSGKAIPAGSAAGKHADPAGDGSVGDIVVVMKACIAEREARLSAMTGLLSTEKRSRLEREGQLFAVGRKYADLKIMSNEFVASQASVMDGLRIELAASKGVDYLGVDGGGVDMNALEVRHARLGSASGAPASPTGGGGLELEAHMAQLEGVKEALRGQIIYNHKACSAIRMLHGDLDRASKQLEELRRK